MKIRIATRESPLALWQANFVKAQLLKLDPTLMVELIGMTTKGDQLLSSSLSKIGGKGLFVKELEIALLEKKADIAVHSMKDVPMADQLLKELSIVAILEREDPRDAFVSNHYQSFEDLPKNARVGTCSLRRKVQIKSKRPDLQLIDLRGNVNSRLQKLDDDHYDAIILAYAGLKRLHLESRIKKILTQEEMLPAVGQGAIGIECLSDNSKLMAILSHLNHAETAICVNAERLVSQTLNGGCQAPIASHAQLTTQGLRLRGLIGDIDSGTLIYSEAFGNASEGEEIAKKVAQDLVIKGANTILSKLTH